MIRDPVYVDAPEEIKAIMDQMMKPLTYKTFQKALWAYALYSNPNNE